MDAIRLAEDLAISGFALNTKPLKNGLRKNQRGSIYRKLINSYANLFFMKCFNHPEIDAVAMCKSCCRGLCHECVSEIGKSASCKNRCEADVTTLNELVQRGSTAYQKTSSTYFRSGIFTVLLGSLFLLIGILSSKSSEPNYFLLVMGALFVGWGISYFVSANRFKK